MRNIYGENTANTPRLKTDMFFADYNNKYHYNGFVDDFFKFIEGFQLTDSVLWR